MRRAHQGGGVEAGQHLPQAARAASRSRPASQVTNRRYGTGRGQPLPVITGEDLPQQDRQRPAIHHNVVIGQHKPVPIRCGADQRRPKHRLAGQIADRGAFSGAHPLDLLIDIAASTSASRSTYRHGTTGSAAMICTGSSNCCAESGHQVRMPGDHRVHRIAQPVPDQARPLTVIPSCTAYTSSPPGGAGVKQQPLLQRGQRQNIGDPILPLQARRSAAGSAGQARYPTGVNPPPPARTCAQMPARASNHNWLSRLTCA